MSRGCSLFLFHPTCALPLLPFTHTAMVVGLVRAKGGKVIHEALLLRACPTWPAYGDGSLRFGFGLGGSGLLGPQTDLGRAQHWVGGTSPTNNSVTLSFLYTYGSPRPCRQGRVEREVSELPVLHSTQSHSILISQHLSPSNPIPFRCCLCEKLTKDFSSLDHSYSPVLFF